MEPNKFHPPQTLFYITACALVALSYQYGQQVGEPTQNSVMISEYASELPKENKNSYSNLPCPTEDEFQAYAQRVKMKIPEGPSLNDVCDDSIRAKLGKVLKLTDEIKFKFPKEWAPTIQPDFSNLLDFIAAHSEEMSLDLNQKGSVAYNKVMERKIFLGGIFFTLEPFDGVSVLIHEARHSSSVSPAHYTCEAGDIPRTPGGCDPYFSVSSSNAGAYSYGTLLQIAMAEFSGLPSDGEKELLLSDAILQITGRFNELPEPLGRFHDMIYVLNEKNEIQFVNPFSLGLETIHFKYSYADEYPVRIEPNSKTGALLIYTNRKYIYSWSEIKGIERFYRDMLPDTIKIEIANRVFLPFQEKALWTFYTQDKKLIYYDFFPEESKYAIKDFPLNRHREKDAKIPDLKHFFLGLYKNAIFLTKEGQLLTGSHYANEPAFIVHPAMQTPAPWKTGTGGALYDSIYAINERGELYTTKVEFVDTDPEVEPDEVWSPKESNFTADARINKFLQGTSLEVGLSEKGTLSLRSYYETATRVLDIKDRVKDFAIFRKPSVHPEMVYDKPHAKSQCGMKMSMRHPWTGGEIGLNEQGQLVSSNAAGVCEVIEIWGSGIESIEWASENPGKAGERTFARPHLRIRRDGQVEKIYPYLR